MANGNLATFLRASRVVDATQEDTVKSKIAPRMLVGYGRQVAMGMEELAKLKVQHWMTVDISLRQSFSYLA